MASESSCNSSVPGLSETVDQKHVGRDLGTLVDQLKVRGGAGGSHMYDLGWRAAVISLFRGQRRVFAIPRTAGLVIARLRISPSAHRSSRWGSP